MKVSNSNLSPIQIFAVFLLKSVLSFGVNCLLMWGLIYLVGLKVALILGYGFTMMTIYGLMYLQELKNKER